MKKNTIAAIIGAAGVASLAVTTYGQGAIFFDNYSCVPYYPVIYQFPYRLAGPEVSVELGYALGAGQTTGFTLIPSSITAINPATPGYFEGPQVIIPGYTSGAVTFEIFAYSSGGLNNGNSSSGNSLYIWTEPSISALPSPAGFFTALPGDIIIPGPEPSTLALAGLGALVSLVAFRRKHS